jgi:hypothetical protein
MSGKAVPQRLFENYLFRPISLLAPMEKYKSFDPVDIGLLRPDAVMLASDDITHLIRQARF